MPKKVFKKINSGLFLSMLATVALTGCSTVGDGVDSVGKGIIYLAEGTQKIASDVQVEKIDDNKFKLEQTFYEPVNSLDSWAMRIEARAACPDGYVYINRNALKDGGFGLSDAECAGSESCDFKLQWRIECQDVPEEPFSFFGKT